MLYDSGDLASANYAVQSGIMQAARKVTAIVVWLCVLLFIVSVPDGVGYAQEPAPSETPTLEFTETPISEATATITETVPPVEGEAPTVPFPEAKSTTRLLVKVSRVSRLANVMTRMNDQEHIIEVNQLSSLGIFILEVPADKVEEKILEVRNASGVLWVEPDYPVQALETIPNDPSFPVQYALTAIHAPQGWDISTGSPGVTIAILDSGVDLTHPDLAGKIVEGFDFVNNDGNPQDEYGHGTHVAGIAAASTNNGIGIAGVSWGAAIMPVQVLNAAGGGNFSDVAAGIVWATDHGAQIINMSLGGLNYSQTLEEAVNYSASRGTLLIAASGNSNSNVVLYPARFPQVMAVAATDASNQRASFSNYGSEVEIAAPGAGILSLWPGGYNTISGTSMATPYVSGLAAILFGYASDASVVREWIKQSALDIAPPGFDIYTGAGLIQMDAALRLVHPIPTVSSASAHNPVVNVPLFSLPTLLWTQTPLATFTPVSVISITASPVSSPVTPQTITLTSISDTAIPDVKAQGNDDQFTSPLFCGGISLILLGGLILFLTLRRRSKPKAR